MVHHLLKLLYILVVVFPHAKWANLVEALKKKVILEYPQLDCCIKMGAPLEDLFAMKTGRLFIERSIF